ncbi:hypothetical protein EVAR_13423_1 [Eumeta japonica]|uniref:Reverse transcriptase domain-containing protein n=1 Tax=Eumeta variegata TaxID=151549 RepID=A0A4C1V8E0_EUMVA|nr:hypothetical protein EVAR_13423_1 [Eumeta japonica]
MYDLKEYEGGLRMDKLSVKCLLCANDQVTVASSACGLQEMVNKMNDFVKKRVMKVNVGKNKVMVFERGESTTECNILIEGDKVEEVSAELRCALFGLAGHVLSMFSRKFIENLPKLFHVDSFARVGIWKDLIVNFISVPTFDSGSATVHDSNPDYGLNSNPDPTLCFDLRSRCRSWFQFVRSQVLNDDPHKELIRNISPHNIRFPLTDSPVTPRTSGSQASDYVNLRHRRTTSADAD